MNALPPENAGHQSPQQHYTRLTDVQEAITRGETSCEQLLRQYIHNIVTQEHLNAFLETWPLEAAIRAREIDEKFKKGTQGRLAGLVLAIKDNLCYKDHKVSASSKILEGFESLFTGTAVQRLLDEDAIIIGRTNCDEFAMGASNENSAYGPVLNHADNSRVPGGSSGGSAVAVQAGMCHAALGSDTGGSIRQPAAFTGIFGLKPSYGMVSRWGLLSYASSFDQIGPLTKSIEDAEIILEVMSGMDEHDATMAQRPAPVFAHAQKRKFKFMVMNDAVKHDGLDADVKKATTDCIEKLTAAGHSVEYFDFPLLDYMVPTYYVLTTAEASSNLSRYSGLMYGYRSPRATDLETNFKYSRSEGFGTEVKRRIMLGTFVLSSDFYDAYYRKAQQVRQVIRQKTLDILATADAILMPTTSTPAFALGEKSKDPLAMYLADLFTVQANLAGVPAISIPWTENSAGLPIGMQVMCGNFQEQLLFDISRCLVDLNG